MSSTTINVRTDAALKSSAAKVFKSIGMDMSTAITIFLRQAVKRNDFPFVIGVPDDLPLPARSPVAARPRPTPGRWAGQVQMSDDFDAPMDDFKEYME